MRAEVTKRTRSYCGGASSDTMTNRTYHLGWSLCFSFRFLSERGMTDDRQLFKSRLPWACTRIYMFFWFRQRPTTVFVGRILRWASVPRRLILLKKVILIMFREITSRRFRMTMQILSGVFFSNLQPLPALCQIIYCCMKLFSFVDWNS